MPLIRIVSLVLTFALMCGAAPIARAQNIEPARDWLSADSEHFRVNYRAPWRAQAERVARAAERAYPKVTKALSWEPRGRTEILLINQYDSPNGFATPLPFNIIAVFLAPPDEGELLDNSDWLDLLLTHEFTHTVHLDKVRGAPNVLQKIFGRQLLFFPNVFQPSWVTEGLAVYHESDAATGRGRLRGPVFEAWLRAEAKSGFLSLKEINADGRALPTSKSYLYGAYFFDFIERRYGKDAIYKYVDGYSGNPPFWPALHSTPRQATGKTMDVLWDEFLADLQQQVAQRSQALVAQPEVAGTRVAGPLFGIGSLASTTDGGTLAVVDDGLRHAKLVRVNVAGVSTELGDVQKDAQIDVAPNGDVLIAQPDICNWRHLAFDLYRLEYDGTLRQLTHCARLRHAVQSGSSIIAIQQADGATRLVQLDYEGRPQRVLWEPALDTSLIDLAASPDGRRVSVASKRGGQWRIDEFLLAESSPARRLVTRHDSPLYNLNHGSEGLEFIAARDGVFDIWRLRNDEWLRVTRTHTRVTGFSQPQDDGSRLLSVVVPGGYELRRLTASDSPLTRVGVAAVAPEEQAAPAANPGASLAEPRPYSALRSVYPRTWFPLVTGERGMFAAGATTLGSDAMGWHQYLASLQFETSQKEVLGSVQYLFQNQHLFTLMRDMEVRSWTADDEVAAYDRQTTAQWLSLFPWLKLDRRVTFGVGAALEQSRRVRPTLTTAGLPKDERLVAALVDYDTSGGNWWSEGANRGVHATLQYETYRPLARADRGDYEGEVWRFDWRAFVPVGRSVIGVRHTEVYADGSTERFELGGANDAQLQLGPLLNRRTLSLRGYSGDEPGLRGANARVTSFEWRSTLADIDRHWMVPALGVNRVSGTLFFDIGGAWNTGGRPTRYSRGVGAELLGEFKAMYALGLQARLGVARGLDGPRDTHAYLAIGRAF